MCAFVLTTGTAGEAAVMVEATHSLAGLIGSVHCLITLHAQPCNITQQEDAHLSNTAHRHKISNTSQSDLIQFPRIKLLHPCLERGKRKLRKLDD